MRGRGSTEGLPGGSLIRASSSQTVMDVVGVIAVGGGTLGRENHLPRSSGAIAVLKNCFTFLMFSAITS